MRKISGKTTNNIILKFVIKAVISTILSIIMFSFIFSEISYHFDVDLKVNMIFTIIICVLCSAVIGYLSVIGIKNNGALLGAIAQIPLIFYSLLNVVFHENTIIFFAIKALIIILMGTLTGYLAMSKSRKLRLN